jgi:thiol:disulfide interchange protein DsbD
MSHPETRPQALRLQSALLLALTVLGLLLVLACAGPPTLTQPEPGNPSAYWVERSEPELDTALRETCVRAQAAGRPVLLSLSAPWCVDCRLLRRLEVEPVLAAELEQWETLVVDVGRLDRHPALLEQFGVRAVATWVALQPTGCREPVSRWVVLDVSRVEPASNPLSKRSPEALARWLRRSREG